MPAFPPSISGRTDRQLTGREPALRAAAPPCQRRHSGYTAAPEPSTAKAKVMCSSLEPRTNNQPQAAIRLGSGYSHIRKGSRMSGLWCAPGARQKSAPKTARKSARSRPLQSRSRDRKNKTRPLRPPASGSPPVGSVPGGEGSQKCEKNRRCARRVPESDRRAHDERRRDRRPQNQGRKANRHPASKQHLHERRGNVLRLHGLRDQGTTAMIARFIVKYSAATISTESWSIARNRPVCGSTTSSPKWQTLS